MYENLFFRLSSLLGAIVSFEIEPIDLRTLAEMDSDGNFLVQGFTRGEWSEKEKRPSENDEGYRDLAKSNPTNEHQIDLKKLLYPIFIINQPRQ